MSFPTLSWWQRLGFIKRRGEQRGVWACACELWTIQGLLTDRSVLVKLPLTRLPLFRDHLWYCVHSSTNKQTCGKCTCTLENYFQSLFVFSPPKHQQVVVASTKWENIHPNLYYSEIKSFTNYCGQHGCRGEQNKTMNLSFSDHYV